LGFRGSNYPQFYLICDHLFKSLFYNINLNPPKYSPFKKDQMKKNWITLISMLFLTTLTVFAQTWLPSFFSDNMVMQQNAEVSIWGKDDPGTNIKISASWGEEAEVVSGRDGRWKTKISTPGAGGPYSMTIEGSEVIELNDVLTGEVWLCSGQSNMEMPVKGFDNQPITGSNEAILRSGNASLRVFQIGRNTSAVPVDDVEGRWQAASPATTPDFSATAYFFGELVQEMLGVPVGLIVTSWGGSKAEAWMDRESLKSFDEIAIPDEVPEKNANQTATILYNGMLHPFIDYHIKGVIWYQGESNRNNAAQYTILFPTLIESWRALWNLGNFPFYFVQISPYGYGSSEETKHATALLREAQLHAMQHVENTGMVVTTDIGDCGYIHPTDKTTVGRRLAYWALAETYGFEGIAYRSPVYSSMETTEDGKIKLSFDYAPSGLASFQKPLVGFEIAGDDQVFYPAQAIINRDKTVSVWNEEVPNPTAVRYAFGDCAEGTLFNIAGLPASPFRTDNWLD
jgi:sialate O-acetylesterase